MNIAFSEPYPILYREWKRRRELFSRGNRIRLCSAEHCRRADLILSDRNSFRASLLPLGELYLVSGEAFIEEAPAEGILLTVGKRAGKLRGAIPKKLLFHYVEIFFAGNAVGNAR